MLIPEVSLVKEFAWTIASLAFFASIWKGNSEDKQENAYRSRIIGLLYAIFLLLLTACSNNPAEPIRNDCWIYKTVNLGEVGTATIGAHYPDCRKLNLDSLEREGWKK